MEVSIWSAEPRALGFWCPLLAGLLFAGRLQWKWAWVPVAVYAACGVPQMLAGKPAWLVLTQWARVHNSCSGILTYGATNWYQWIADRPRHLEILESAGIGIALLGTALFVRWMKRSTPSNADRWLVSLALLSVLFPPFLLPGMHERYFFPADVLSVVYAFCVAGGWRVAALMQFASAFSYFPFLFDREPVPRAVLALAVLTALGFVVRDVIRVQMESNSQKEAP